MGISGINLTLLAAGDHYDPAHHVQDAVALELPFGIHIPVNWIDTPAFTLTKFMLLQLVAFGLALWIFRGLAQRAATGKPIRGRWWNFWESIVLYLRDEVVRPTIGDEHHDEHGHDEQHADGHGGAGHAHHDGHGHGEVHVTPGGAIAVDVTHPADKYLPFVLSCFFYVLFCNLLGAFPFLGSATGDINVTGALALVVFAFVMFYGSRELGVAGFWANLVPSMELPFILKIVLIPPIWAIELLGLFIKHGVLAVRLFANIMAGHTVLAVVLGFIFNAANTPLWWVVTPASIFGQVAIGMLELFVAFLQAYVFAFLATLFIGAAVHQH
jgi:F-type H+-transporting ATPase subunit a